MRQTRKVTKQIEDGALPDYHESIPSASTSNIESRVSDNKSKQKKDKKKKDKKKKTKA